MPPIAHRDDGSLRGVRLEIEQVTRVAACVSADGVPIQGFQGGFTYLTAS
jgi:hypothetical protein